jgi:hypothetical protein
MLDNYKMYDDGRVRQIETKPFVYDYSYSDIYNSEQYKLNSKLISYLRYGYIVGSIGRTPTSILDVGYGNGEFLLAASNQVIDCFGYDVSDYPIPDGIQRSPSMFDRKYDVITFFDSLEHFPDIDFVKELKCNFVCISVPNCFYFSDEWFDNWKHRKPDEHIWHFNYQALVGFMGANGYWLVNSTDVEDTIRKNNQPYSNILTCVFKKNYD